MNQGTTAVLEEFEAHWVGTSLRSIEDSILSYWGVHAIVVDNLLTIDEKEGSVICVDREFVLTSRQVDIAVRGQGEEIIEASAREPIIAEVNISCLLEGHCRRHGIEVDIVHHADSMTNLVELDFKAGDTFTNWGALGADGGGEERGGDD